MPPDRPTLQARYDPPVAKLAWTVDRDQPLAAFLDDARRRCDLDDTAWQRMLWHGGLHVARRRVFQNATRKDGPQGASPPDPVPAGAAATAFWFDREPQRLPLTGEDLLFHAHDVVALRKPAWLPTQPTRASARFCLEQLARELLGVPSLWAANRLDRGTSGVVLLTGTPTAARHLHAQLSRRRVERRYLAVVAPPPSRSAWQVEGYLQQTAHPSHAYYTLRHDPALGARHSRTDFALLESWGDRALVEARPHTGRTHQLRVHLAAGGTPIVGDGLYADVDGWPPDSPWTAPRLMLHAESARFYPAPDTALQTVCAPLPADWRDALSR